MPRGAQFTLSATAVPRRGGPSDYATLEVRGHTADGDYCGRSYVQTSVGAAAATTTLVGGPGLDCDQPGRHLARVTIQDYGGDPTELPIEVSLDVSPPGEPVPVPPGTTPATPEDEPIGGASYATAALVEPGSYTDNIRMLEVQYWAVEIQRGQTLTVEYQGQPITSDEDAGVLTSVNSGLRVPADRDDALAEDRDAALSEGWQLGFTTPRIAVGDPPRGLDRPGLHYVSVSLCCGPETALVDYELTLALEGDPLHDPTPTAATSAPTDPASTPASDPATEAAAPDADASDTSSWGWVLVGLLLLAGLAGGGWALYRAGRNAARPDAS